MSPSDRADDRFTALEKLRILGVAAGLSDNEVGAFLRKEGVSEQQLKRWQKEAETALAPSRKRRRRSDREKDLERQNRELQREIRRKDKALAEASALLVLKKKAAAIWGDADDDMDEESD